jgi:peroxiredoxin family protein
MNMNSVATNIREKEIRNSFKRKVENLTKVCKNDSTKICACVIVFQLL